jgi:glycosyltransferase involved in cell wall biosynthesis
MDMAPIRDPSRTVILQVLPALGGGGVERGTVEMAQAITEAGGVALVASEGGRMARLVEAVGGRNVLLPLASKSPLGIWRNAARLETLIRAEGVSLVHARSRAPAWSAWLATQRTGVPFVTTYHGAYGESAPGKRRYNSVMARGERVIAISQFIADLILHRHRIDPARIRVIHRGVDPAVFDPEAVSGDRVQQLAEAWHLPEGRPLIMLPGRLTSWKGQEVLIAALARMARRDAVGVLVGAEQGRSRYARGLIAQAAECGVDVRLVGDCDDMPAALTLADAVVNASTKPEAFGRVVIEAQSMARPVIATDHGGAVETVEHGGTGWRVPAGDPDALAAALDHVLASAPERLASLGARARASVQANYTVEKMQDATLDVYREVLGMPAAARGEAVDGGGAAG